jgi:hypothetical protein
MLTWLKLIAIGVIFLGTLLSGPALAVGDPNDVAVALREVSAAIAALPGANLADDAMDSAFPVPPESLNAGLQKIRDSLREMVNADIAGGIVEPAALQSRINEQLQKAGILRRVHSKSKRATALAPQWGAILAVGVSKSLGRIVVKATFSQPCGTGSALWVFERASGTAAYSLVLRDEDLSFAADWYLAALNGGEDPLDFYVFRAFTPTQCNSSWYELHYEVLVPTEDPSEPKSIFTRSTSAYLGPGAGRTLATRRDRVLFQYFGSDEAGGDIQKFEVELLVQGHQVTQICRRRVPRGSCLAMDQEPADATADNQATGGVPQTAPQPAGMASPPNNKDAIFIPLPAITYPVAAPMPARVRPSIEVDEAYERVLEALAPRIRTGPGRRLDLDEPGSPDEYEEQAEAWCALADSAKGHPYENGARANCSTWNRFLAIWRPVMASLDRDADTVERFLRLNHKTDTEKARVCAEFSATYLQIKSMPTYQRAVKACVQAKLQPESPPVAPRAPVSAVPGVVTRPTVDVPLPGVGAPQPAAGSIDLLPKTQEEVTAMPTFSGDSARFVVRGDVVDDKVRTLVWQRSHSSQDLNWAAAKAYCGQLHLAGYTGWRLPTIAELHSTIGMPHAGEKTTPIFQNYQGWYWSGTAWGEGSSAWYVNFDSSSNSFGVLSTAVRVRCVRQLAELK